MKEIKIIFRDNDNHYMVFVRKGKKCCKQSCQSRGERVKKKKKKKADSRRKQPRSVKAFIRASEQLKSLYHV